MIPLVHAAGRPHRRTAPGGASPKARRCAGPRSARPKPGTPPPDYAALRKAEFVKWLAGPGKDYRVKKLVPKAAAEKTPPGFSMPQGAIAE